MKIKIKRDCVIKGAHAAAGTTLEVDAATGNYLINIKRATLAADKPATKKKATKKKATAAEPPADPAVED